MMRWQVWMLSAVLLGGAGGAGVRAESLDEQLRTPVDTTTLTQTRDIADQLLRLGRQQAAAGQYEAAIRSWTRAVDLYYEIGDQRSMGIAYENLGQVYAQVGQYAEAETAIRRQLALARDEQNFEAQIFAWNTLGSLQLQSADLSSAQMAFQEALAVAQSVSNYEGMGLSLSNLGLVASLQNQQQDAIKYYEAAANYRARVGDYVGQAQTDANLGDAYLAFGRTLNAIGAYRVALSLGREVENTGIQFRALDGLIQAYRDRGELSTVQVYLDQRLALTNAVNDDWQRLLSWQQLGAFYQETDNLPAAQAAYQQALTLARSLEQKQLEGELTNRLIELARLLGD